MLNSEGFDQAVLTIITGLPFAASLILVFWPGNNSGQWKYFSVLVAIATTVLSLYVLLQ